MDIDGRGGVEVPDGAGVAGTAVGGEGATVGEGIAVAAGTGPAGVAVHGVCVELFDSNPAYGMHEGSADARGVGRSLPAVLGQGVAA